MNRKQGLVGVVGLLAFMVWAPLVGAFQSTQASQTSPVAPLSREFAPKPYTVAAGDKVQLDFYNLVGTDLDMKKAYLVEPDGSIQVKHVGSVAVHGKTAPEIADAVLKALEKNQIYPAGVVQVTAAISEERVQRVQVQGQVMAPGEKQLRGNQMTVSRAIAAANNFTPMAGEEIEVKRIIDGKDTIFLVTRSQLNGGDDPPLIAEDIVTVKQGHIFFVNGEVNLPGQKVWSPGMTVLKAIGLANGMNPKGKLGHILRQVKGKDGKVTTERIKIKMETLVLPDDQLFIAKKWFG